VKTEHVIVLVVGTLALYALWRIMRSPSARIDRKRREARARFRRSLVNRSNQPWR
jgi:hypothetical protein